MNIESTPLGVECDVRHLPGRHQAKCTSKQDAGWVFQVETSCGNRDPGTIASTHSNQRGAVKIRAFPTRRVRPLPGPPPPSSPLLFRAAVPRGPPVPVHLALADVGAPVV